MKKFMNEVFSRLLALLTFLLVMLVMYDILATMFAWITSQLNYVGSEQEYIEQAMQLQVFTTFIVPAMTGLTFYMLSKFNFTQMYKNLFAKIGQRMSKGFSPKNNAQTKTNKKAKAKPNKNKVGDK